jgi:hypothetical protein
MRTVITGESDTRGKIRYAGPLASAWNSRSWPPAPVSPAISPYTAAIGRRSNFLPRIAKYAGMSIVRAQMM